jgi:prepilin-type N-terminal cleavage/methylation domain-containing protein
MRMHLSRSSTPARRRRGFTFIELLIAMTVAAVLMGITIPRMVPVRERASVRSAKQAVMGHLATARQAAIRRSAPATFHIDGDSVWVTVSGTTTRIVPAVDVNEQNGVDLESPMDSVTFNPRGFANPRLDEPKILVLTRGHRKDSVCVTVLGMLGQCGL